MKAIPASILLKGLLPAEETPIPAVVTDSRKVCKDCVFVCFPGARVDGHDFALGAWEAGAAYLVVNHYVDGIPRERQLLVEDSRTAMLAMASNYRDTVDPLLIGVTGSVGKTTTKEFCYAILSAFGEAIKTEGNQNNEIGVPNTIFRMEDTTRYGVVEMGMSHLNEISALVKAARPQAGLITCIGVSHIENLGSRENIRKAKLEICEGLPQNAPLALNADDDMLWGCELPGSVRPIWYGIDNPEADVRAVNIEAEGSSQRFTLVDSKNGSFTVTIPTRGRHTVYDALAAYTAAVGLGLDAAKCAAALANYQSTGMRQRMVEHKGVAVVEDCYNASPDSMKAALTMFRDIKANRHVALLGDMLELGTIAEEAHRQVGRWAAEYGVDLLVAYGPQSAVMAEEAEQAGIAVLHCVDRQQAANALAEALRPGDALLAKASRGTALEKILELYYAV